MCGIFGVINNPRIDIKNSLDSIAHRGPDDEGLYKDDNITLGFRRLSIIDLSPKGHQPMSDQVGDVWIIFNGEIYNYQELRDELVKKYKFKSTTDTEVLIYGYKKWGIDGLLKRINGMYGFCIYDKKKATSYLVRDRIGKKPVYYYKAGSYLAFSSETKAFFHLPDFKFDINEEAFSIWLGFPYLADNKETLLKNVHKVKPGHYLTVVGSKTTEKKYWDLKVNKEDAALTLPQAEEKLESLLSDSIEKRLIADVPVGILLSGGLDSSLVTAFACRNATKQVKTINISFKNSTIDESKYAEIVSKHCNANLVKLKLDVSDAYKKFKENIWIFDDLSTVDGGLFSTFLLSEKIREIGVKVVLVGEGADEVFAGYTWFGLSKLPFKILSLRAIAKLYYYSTMRIINNAKFRRYPKILAERLAGFSGSTLKKVQTNEIKFSLPNHYCMKVDKGSSGASIEARAPFLDYRIVNFAHSIKDEYLLGGKNYSAKNSNEKLILRKIAAKYLPKEIYSRKKRGGMLPVDDILNIGIQKDTNLILDNSYLTDFFGKKYLSKLISSKPKSKPLKWQREWILWKCLVFALWHDHYSKLIANKSPKSQSRAKALV